MRKRAIRSTTAILVDRAKRGHKTSRNQLVHRCLPWLRKMAHGRVPATMARVVDVDDIVQETLMRAFNSLDDFEPRCPGAFLYYLRRILINYVCDLSRKGGRTPSSGSLESEPEAQSPSPVEEAVGREVWKSYQQSVDTLSEGQREAVVLFVECGMDFNEVAEAMESPSPNAARMVVARGLKKLAERMRIDQGGA